MNKFFKDDFVFDEDAWVDPESSSIDGITLTVATVKVVKHIKQLSSNVPFSGTQDLPTSPQKQPLFE